MTTAHARRVLAITFVLTLAAFAIPQGASACEGPPPEPSCGKTIELSLSGADNVFTTAGGIFPVSAEVFFSEVDFPAGSGICPAPPFTVDVEIVALCLGGGNGGGAVFGVPIGMGPNQISVPVAIPPGPPRPCGLGGTAKITLGDGMVLTEDARIPVCVVDEIAPGVPVIDVQRMGPPAGQVQLVHPSDPTAFTHRLVNNDPNRPFHGTLRVTSHAEGRLPGMSGPQPPGTGVFSTQDPVQADHPSIGVEDQYPDGCVPFHHFADPNEPETLRNITLLPGEQRDIRHFVRYLGMCSDGSCGGLSLVLEGQLGGGAPQDALACSGIATLASTDVAPQYQCLGSGMVSQVLHIDPNQPQAPFFDVFSQVTPIGMPVHTLARMQTPQVLLDGNNPLPPANQLGGNFTSELGRLRTDYPLPPIPVDSFFDVFYQIGFDGPPGTQIVEAELLSGPTGFAHVAPTIMARLRLPPPGPSGIDTFFDMTYQLSGRLTDPQTIQERRLQYDQVQFMTAGPALQVHARTQAEQPPGPSGPQPDGGPPGPRLELRQDLRAFGFSGGGDRDQDGVQDALDNCLYVANPGQEDTGGINTPIADGIGNACQCGDITNQGIVNGQDGFFITRHGLGAVDPLFVDGGKCDVTGNGLCNGQDGVFVTRAGLGYLDPMNLSPLGQNCHNADPAAPPCPSCLPCLAGTCS